MKIRELAEKHNDYIVEQRRWFHRHPELSHKEVETTNAIVKQLEEMGIPVTRFDGITGCVGLIEGGKPGPTVLLRADIDALPVPEQSGLPFASENEGVMHACGHDAHIAMLLGAGKILKEMQAELPGKVKLFFQMAEETAMGAKMSVEKGLMEGVDASFGMHVGGLPAGTFNLETGPRMASCDTFTLTIKGDSAHGSTPHQGHDAVLAAAATVMNLQSIVSRRTTPLNPLVVTVGTINGGQRFNIIADKVEMDGTTRTYDREVRMQIEGLVREIAESTAKAYGCTAELQYNYLIGPVFNDSEKAVRIGQEAVKKLWGDEALVPMPMMTGSEDYAYLMDNNDSCYGFLGCNSPDVPGSEKSNHHPCYTVDETTLHKGAAIAAQFALDYMLEGK